MRRRIARLEARVLRRLGQELPPTRWQRLCLNACALFIHLRNAEFKRAWFQLKGIVRVLTGQ